MSTHNETAIADTVFAAIDFESAGSRPGETDVPVQIGIACMGKNLEIQTTTFFRSYLAPGREVSWAASKIHGIATSDLDGAPSILSLWPEIKNRLAGNAIVAHAASTEKRFLSSFPMHRFAPWVDSLRVARAAYPAAPDHSLGEMLAFLNLVDDMGSLCPNLRWHDALYDAVASLVLLRHIIRSAESQNEPLSLLIRPDLAAYYRARAQTRRT